MLNNIRLQLNANGLQKIEKHFGSLGIHSEHNVMLLTYNQIQLLMISHPAH